MSLKLGIFDSGVGGLTVAKSLYDAKLFDEIIYFGDTARVPYGNRVESTIISYSLESFEFLKNFDINYLITACNSVSSCALPTLKKETTIPVIGVIEAGIAAIDALSLKKNATILVIGTKATIHSHIYQNSLKERGFNNIIALPTPLFVPTVEEEIYEGAIVESMFHHYFSHLDSLRIDAVILGCTHFPMLFNALQRYFPQAKLIHSGDAIAKLMKKEYGLIEKEKTKIEFFASENGAGLKKIAKEWLNL